MTCSGSLKPNISIKRRASGVASSSSCSDRLKSADLRSKSKLGRLDISALACSMRLMTEGRRAGRVSAPADDVVRVSLASSDWLGSSAEASGCDNLLRSCLGLGLSLGNVAIDLSSLCLEKDFLCFFVSGRSTVVCEVLGGLDGDSLEPSSSSLLLPSKRVLKSTREPAAAIRPNMLWFILTDMGVGMTSACASSAESSLSSSGSGRLGVEDDRPGVFLRNLRGPGRLLAPAWSSPPEADRGGEWVIMIVNVYERRKRKSGGDSGRCEYSGCPFRGRERSVGMLVRSVEMVLPACYMEDSREAESTFCHPGSYAVSTPATG